MSRASLDSGGNADKKSASENSWKRESNEGGEFVTVVYMRDILSAIILLTPAIHCDCNPNFLFIMRLQRNLGNNRVCRI